MSIKKKFHALCIGITVLLVLGCQNSTTSAPSGSGETKLSATDLVASIPTIETLLPKSLQAGDSTDGAVASNLARNARAIGDVTALDPASLNGVTADGYKEMRDSVDNSMAKMFLDLLKYALNGKNVNFGEPYTIGVMTLPDYMGGGPDGSNSMDLGKVTITNPSAGMYDVRWFIKFQQTRYEGQPPVEGLVYLYIQILGDDPATMQVKSAMHQVMGTEWYEDYSGYNATSNKMESVGLSYEPEYNYLRSITTANGYVTYYDISNDWKRVAYANDSMGGVVNWSKNTWNGTEQENIWTEFYNSQGDLVMNQWGTTSNSNNGNISWATEQIKNSNSINMHDLNFTSKPETIYRKTEFTSNYINPPYSYSLTTSWSKDQSSWITQTSETWSPDGSAHVWNWSNPVWMAGEDVAAGDSIYYYQSGDWTNTNESGIWKSTSIDTYKVGYTIPSPVSYLGQNYYINNTFLLKHCRLPVEMQGKYELKMKEGNTWYNWESSDTGWTCSETKPANWDTISNNDKCSWINYTYWLENKVYTNTDGIDDNSELSQDSDKGDLPASNLYEQNFWLWENGESKQLKAQVISTTESQPVGFNFIETALVDSVKSKIENIYQNEIPNMTEIDFKARAAAICTLPDLATFPKY